MRIFGHMVVKNEADRYLTECIEWHLPHLDGLHVYDDHSSDRSTTAAFDAGATAVSCSMVDVSFLENEAAVRQAAWGAMELTLRPIPGDWILCIDADEFFMSTRDDPLGKVLRGAAAEARKYALRGGPTNAIRFNVEEVFGDDGVHTFVRSDGFWSRITAERFIAYQPAGEFASRIGMGGGSLPSYKQVYPKTCTAASIVHVGYLDPRDRIRKYDRYAGAHGHGTKHVKSILKMPELVPLRPDIMEAPWRR